MYRCFITRKKAILSGLFILATSPIVLAEIAMDGTLGPAGPLAGPHYAIPAELGQQHGGNLFHSFSQFSILSNESATFSGPDSVQNLIGRVTGGAPSSIDGTLRSTIPGASLYLVNPAGVLFGEQAQVDVGGSFYVSTADVLRFGDGGRFDARNPHRSTLSAAPIAAFGFLGNAPGRIELDGGFLRLREGQTLALIGGDITLHNATLYVPAGRIDLAAVDSAGDVLPTATGLEMDGVTRLGDLRITRDPTVASPEIDGRPVEDVDASGPGGGAIVIRAANMQAEGVMLSTDTRGDQPGGGIDIALTGDLTITRGGQIHSNAFGSGNAGNVTVSANNLLVDGADAPLPSDNTADLLVDGTGTPPPPPDDGPGTTPPPPDDGPGSGPSPQPPPITGINSSAGRDSSGGAGGLVNVTVAGDLILMNGGEISSRSGGTGPAGKIIVRAGNLLLDGGRSGISSNAGSGSSGAGGVDLTVDDTLTLLSGGKISVTSFGAGPAGDVTVHAGRAINISGISLTLTPEGDVAPSSLSIDAHGTGQAGNLTITTAKLTLADGGVINAQSELSSGGNIWVNADHTLLQSGGKISASVYGDPQTEGGDVIINGDTLVILASPGPADTPPTGITARATQGRGGNIIINTDVFLHNALSVDEVLNASSEVLGNDGAVEVNSPPVDIAGTLVQTPVSYLDASGQLQRRCGGIAANERHRLTLPGPGGLPPEPEGPLPTSSRCAAEPVVLAESSTAPPVALPPQTATESATGWGDR